eukprot:TRINITY_DN8243_c0_g1_i2.p1 TRINITY_DN8243_c0_g1~~TRINITY_DN8243_c0_g1_i2.p1  ORF type:complete len:2027 (+),score=506.89 TRINITY_DN8243_c0_g1_i2:151-6081(+)
MSMFGSRPVRVPAAPVTNSPMAIPDDLIPPPRDLSVIVGAQDIMGLSGEGAAEDTPSTKPTKVRSPTMRNLRGIGGSARDLRMTGKRIALQGDGESNPLRLSKRAGPLALTPTRERCVMTPLTSKGSFRSVKYPGIGGHRMSQSHVSLRWGDAPSSHSGSVMGNSVMTPGTASAKGGDHGAEPPSILSSSCLGDLPRAGVSRAPLRLRKLAVIASNNFTARCTPLVSPDRDSVASQGSESMNGGKRPRGVIGGVDAADDSDIATVLVQVKEAYVPATPSPGRRRRTSTFGLRRATFKAMLRDTLQHSMHRRQLLKEWGDSNQDSGITSFMVVCRDCAVQSIEGPDEAVTALLKRIRSDSRQHNMTVIEFCKPPARLFHSHPLSCVTAEEAVAERDEAMLVALKQLEPWLSHYLPKEVLSVASDDDTSNTKVQTPLENLSFPHSKVSSLPPSRNRAPGLKPTGVMARAVLAERIDVRWRPAVLCSVLYFSFIVPIMCGLDRPLSPGWTALSMFMLLVWWLEIVLRTWRPKMRAGVLDSEAGASWKAYARGSFLWDALAGMPLFVVGLALNRGSTTAPFSGAEGIVHPVWFLNHLMVFRDADSYALWIMRSMDVPPRMARILRCFALFAVVCHFVGCLWLLLVHYERTSDSDGAMAWHGQAEVFWTRTGAEQYWISLDQGIKMMGGMAKSGTSMPQTELQAVFATVAALAGVTLYSTVIATIGSLVTERISEEEQLQDRLDKAFDVFKYYGLPRDFVTEAKGFMVHVSQTSRKLVTITDILGDLHSSIALRMETLVGGDTIKKLPMFALAVEDARFLHFMLSGLQPRTFCRGEFIMRKGDEGDEMFFVVSGETMVIGDGDVVLVVLGGGSFFGEIALLNACRRTATIRAGSHCSCLRLGRETFEEAEELFPRAIETVRAYAHKRLQQIKLAEIVENTTLFADLAEDTDFIGEIVGRMKPVVAAPGAEVLSEGTIGTSMYFVGKGHLSVVDGAGETVGALGSGDFFGDMSLIYNIRCSASVVAERYTDLFVLSRSDFQDIQVMYPTQTKVIEDTARTNFQRYALADIIEKVPMFSATSAEFKAALVRCLRLVELQPGESACKEGEVGEEMYFISRGTLNVQVAGIAVAELQEGGFFGEVALFFDTLRTATIVAKSVVELFVLTKADFGSNIASVFEAEAKAIEAVATERFNASKLQSVVRKVPLFEALANNTAFVEAVCAELRKIEVEPGEVIVSQSEIGDALFCVFRGELEEVVDGRVVRRLAAGDFFGDESLLWRLRRPCTVRASASAEVFILDLSAYDAVRLKFPAALPHLETAAETYQKEALERSLRSTPMFSAVGKSSGFLKAVVGKMVTLRQKPGVRLATAGDPATECYVVLAGSVSACDSGAGVQLMEYSEGEVCDEELLVFGFYRRKRTLVLKAPEHGPCQVFSLSRADFRAVAKTHAAELQAVVARGRQLYRDEFLEDALRSAPVFAHLESGSAVLLCIAKAFVPETVEAMQTVYRQGDLVSWMGVVMEGSLAVSSIDAPDSPHALSDRHGSTPRLTAGDYFGLNGMAFGVPRKSSVNAAERTELYILHKQAFEEVLSTFFVEGPQIKAAILQEYRTHGVGSLVRTCGLFSDVSDEFFLDAVVGRVEPRGLPAAVDLTTLGAPTEGVYIVCGGRLECSGGVADTAESNGGATQLWSEAKTDTVIFEDGGCISSYALWYDGPCMQTVRTLTPVELCVLSKKDWAELASRYPEVANKITARVRADFQENLLMHILDVHPLFRGVSQGFRIQFLRDVARLCTIRVYRRGSVLVANGDSVSSLYHTARGTLEVTCSGSRHSLPPGTFFGGIGLIRDAKCPSVITAADDISTFELSKDSFAAALQERWPGAPGAMARNVPALLDQAMSTQWMPRPEVVSVKKDFKSAAKFFIQPKQEADPERSRVITKTTAVDTLLCGLERCVRTRYFNRLFMYRLMQWSKRLAYAAHKRSGDSG